MCQDQAGSASWACLTRLSVIGIYLEQVPVWYNIPLLSVTSLWGVTFVEVTWLTEAFLSFRMIHPAISEI